MSQTELCYCGATGKQFFAHAVDARAAAQAVGRRNAAPTVNAFQCGSCGGWHIGNRYKLKSPEANWKRSKSTFKRRKCK